MRVIPTTPRSTDGQRLGLNHSELTYLAAEGVAGSVTQVYAVRLEGPLDPSAIRPALGELVRAHPRLRGVVERTLLGHRLRIRPFDRSVECLLDRAVHVDAVGPTDDEAIPARMNRLLAEPFAVERDLPIKAHVVPHPARPLLVLAFHHVAGDGRSIVGWLRDLVALLNGKTIDAVDVDPPTYWAALVPHGLRGWWGSLRAWLRQARVPKEVLRMPRRPFDGFPNGAVQIRRLAMPGSRLGALAKSLDMTVGALVFGVHCLALRRVVSSASKAPIRARMSIDLRAMFPNGRGPGDGNFVSSFFVNVDALDTEAVLHQAQASMRAEVERFQARGVILTAVFNSLSLRLGRKLFGMLALGALTRDRLPRQSLFLSNLGRIDSVNDAAELVRVDAVYPSLPPTDLFVAVAGMHGRMHVSACYPDGVIDAAEVRRVLDEVEAVLAELDDQRAQSDADVSPPGASGIIRRVAADGVPVATARAS